MNIIIYPDEILRQKTSPIEEIDDTVRKNAEDMLKLMYKMEGVGLAGPQVGWSKSLIVIDASGDKEGERVFINPVIVEDEGILLSDEGCLSFPGITGKISRADEVEVVAYNLKGEQLKITAGGLLSRVFQHEIDHLNGKLFIDKMTSASGLSNAQKLKELEQRYRKVRAS